MCNLGFPPLSWSPCGPSKSSMAGKRWLWISREKWWPMAISCDIPNSFSLVEPLTISCYKHIASVGDCWYMFVQWMINVCFCTLFHMLFCSLTSQYNIYECPTGLGNLGGKQELDLGQDELEELANEAFVRLWFLWWLKYVGMALISWWYWPTELVFCFCCLFWQHPNR